MVDYSNGGFYYEDNFEYEGNFKYEDNINYEDNLKYEDNLRFTKPNLKPTKHTKWDQFKFALSLAQLSPSLF